MNSTKTFDLQTILTITTGRFICGDFDKIYKILGHMTAMELYTHQLPKASKPCEEWLKANFPKLIQPDLEARLCELCDAGVDAKSDAYLQLLGEFGQRAGSAFDIAGGCVKYTGTMLGDLKEMMIEGAE